MVPSRIPLLLTVLSVLSLACSGEQSGSNSSPGGTSASSAGAAGSSAAAAGGTSSGGTSAAAGQDNTAGTAAGGTSSGGSGGTGGEPAGGSGGAAGGTGGSSGTGDLAWPDGKVAAVSLTYDDGLDGQLKYALPQLDAAGLKGTFFLASFQGVPHNWSLPNTTDPLNARHQAWQAVLAEGHELASHTVYHPCDDNNQGYRPEDYDMAKMGAELDDSLARLMRLGAPMPITFAFPCGGDRRGIGPTGDSMSYAPLVAERFLAARVSDSGVADPASVDLQTVSQFGTTDATGPELTGHIDDAIAAGGWVVFTFHGVGPEDTSCNVNTFDLDACALNYLTTPADSHQELVDYLVTKQSEVWVAPFKEVAQHIAAARP